MLVINLLYKLSLMNSNTWFENEGEYEWYILIDDICAIKEFRIGNWVN
jgi:hypothetical protein